MGEEISVGGLCSEVGEFGEGEKGVEEKIEEVMKMKGKKCVECMEKEVGGVMWE